MIDTHCHLTFPDFCGRIADQLAEGARLGVTGFITISTTTHDCLEALALAKEYRNVWCTSGIHPLHSHEGEDGAPGGTHNWSNLRAVASDPSGKCVAWGELGLDNHYKTPAAAHQRAVLDEQLAFIESCRRGDGSRPPIDLPIVIHCREAFDDLIPILKRTSLDPTRFVFHCFTGTVADAREVLDFGASISFTGVATYKSAAEVREAARLVPPDRIMVETDAPFLSPEPHRGSRPCRPAWVRHVAEAIAAARGVGFGEFHEQVNQNTERFFGVPAR
ncbi:MAG: TatD family hydrolase [Phycisphaerales bacterium]|nr:TatD family hydrolase [Phycisphaerales bacterium]